MTRLADVASVIRSKNAGPFELTLDIIFTDRFWFEEALRRELISGPVIARLYGIAESDVLSVVPFPPALASKSPRRWGPDESTRTLGPPPLLLRPGRARRSLRLGGARRWVDGRKCPRCRPVGQAAGAAAVHGDRWSRAAK